MSSAGFWVHPSALVESEDIGAGTRIWAFAHVLKGARIGRDCNIGDGAFLESGAVIGDRVTVKNHVLLWEGVTVEDDVFLGPGVVFTNDLLPRSPRFAKATARYADKGWLVPTKVERGASLGANSTIRCGVTLGAFCMVGAGAVVSKSVPPHALMLGVPAERVGWVSEAGQPLSFDESGMATCAVSGDQYALVDGAVTLCSRE